MLELSASKSAYQASKALKVGAFRAFAFSGLNQRSDRQTTLRSILKSLVTGAKISVSVALSVPGFLKVEVSYARDLTKPHKNEDA